MTPMILKFKFTLAAAAFTLAALSPLGAYLCQSGGLAAAATAHEAAKDMVRVPVLREKIMVGATITGNDIIYIKIPAGQVTNNIITDPQHLIGMAAAWSLAAERPIRETDIRRPVLTKKGSLVTMIVTLPNIKLTAVGRALENGALGDTIRVVNTTSSKTVEGIVLADGNVAVGKGIRTASISN